MTTTGESTDAMAYGLGSNGGYTLKNENNYKMPTIVQSLASTGPAFKSESSSKESTDEIPSITNYFDGSERLNTFKVECKMYASINDCLHQASCGWCGESKLCIMGNQMGPMEMCSKSTYIFTSGAMNPDVRVMKDNVGGLSTVITSNEPGVVN